MNEQTLKILNMSGLDRGAIERDASPSQPQPSTPPAPAAVPSSADAPTPADEDEYSNCSADDGEDDCGCVEPTTTKRCYKMWTENEDIALVAALRAGQKVSTIEIAGRSGKAAKERLHSARTRGSGSPALREYLKETCPEYVYKPPPTNVSQPWSEEEELTFIQAHREGKTLKEIAAILPGRTENAVESRWNHAKKRKTGTAALREYAAECTTTNGNCWSEYEDNTFIRAQKEGKTPKEIAAILPGRTKGAVSARWHDVKLGKKGTATLRAYVAEITPSAKFSPWSEYEDNALIRAHKEGKTPLEIAALLPGRTNTAVKGRWQLAKNGKRGSAALRAYAAEYCLQSNLRSISQECF